MSKWIKRIGLAIGIVLLLIAAGAWIVYHRANAVPDWYAQAKTVVSDDPDLENRTTMRLHNWASKASAGDPAHKPQNERRFTVQLTADDINRLIVKWSRSTGLEDKMSRHVQDIRVRLADGKITIAGLSPEYQKVLSASLEPVSGADGYAQLRLDALYAGDLQLPLVSMKNYRSRLSEDVARQAAQKREKIAVDDHSVATRATADLYYADMAAALFAGHAADAYAFIGRVQGLSMDDPLASRVCDIKVEQGKLTMTLEMLDARQREVLTDHLQSIGNPKSPSDTKP